MFLAYKYIFDNTLFYTLIILIFVNYHLVILINVLFSKMCNTRGFDSHRSRVDIFLSKFYLFHKLYNAYET